jgi:NTP pyrophosphatase (non-canonical NTP hydrolase)
MSDLAALQRRIDATFGAKDRARGADGTFLYLVAEIGELAEAVRERGRHDLDGEFADCVAWLCSLANLTGVDLAAAVARKYPMECTRCGATPCACATKP